MKDNFEVLIKYFVISINLKKKFISDIREFGNIKK